MESVFRYSWYNEAMANGCIYLSQDPWPWDSKQTELSQYEAIYAAWIFEKWFTSVGEDGADLARVVKILMNKHY